MMVILIFIKFFNLDILIMMYNNINVIIMKEKEVKKNNKELNEFPPIETNPLHIPLSKEYEC